MSEPFIRIYHQTGGSHVHMRVFVGTGAKSGDLVVTTDEWPTFKKRLVEAGAAFTDETPKDPT